MNNVTRLERQLAQDARAASQSDVSAKAAGATRTRIGIIGYFGCANLGNEGSLEAILTFLRRARPDARVSVICPDPATAARQHRVAAIATGAPPVDKAWFRALNRLLLKLPARLLDISRTLRQVRDYDILLVPGTGILDDLGERPGGMPYTLVRWFACARLLGRKVALVSIGAGPIVNPANRRLLKLAARLANYRSYRDLSSKTYLAGLGLDTSRDPVVADVAFGLESPRRSSTPRSDVTVGLGIMDYHGWYPWSQTAAATKAAYLQDLALLGIHLLEKGYRVRLLMGQESDREAIDSVTEKIAAHFDGIRPERLVFDWASSLHDVMRQMTDTDLVVATRFHNIVCAMNVGLPVISLSYAPKNDALLNDAGLGAFSQHCEKFDVEAILEQIERQIRERDHLSALVTTAVDRYRRVLKEQEDALLNRWL
jgi:polysaccharide pyruvyl transferase WcaK-like protein